MDDLSRLICRITFEHDGRHYICGPFTLGDWSALQSHVASEKQRRLIGPALSRPIPSGMAKIVKDKVEGIGTTIPERDIYDLLHSTEGQSFALWLMLEREYPGRFQPSDTLRMVSADTVDGALLRLRLAEALGFRYSIDLPESEREPMPMELQPALGWRWALWLATRPSTAEPAGLGMSMLDAMKLSYVQVMFLFLDEKEIKAISHKMRAAQLRASGVTQQNIEVAMKDYWKTKRQKYAGAEAPVGRKRKSKGKK